MDLKLILLLVGNVAAVALAFGMTRARVDAVAASQNEDRRAFKKALEDDRQLLQRAIDEARADSRREVERLEASKASSEAMRALETRFARLEEHIDTRLDRHEALLRSIAERRT